MTQPRMLVCSAAVGHGHCRAAEIIADLMRDNGASVQRLEALEFAPAWFNGIYRGAYLRAIQSLPAAQRWLYASTDHPCDGRSFGEAIERAALRSFTERVEDESPDAIICTHFLCARVLCARRAAGTIKCPIAVCITDQHPHGVWLSRHADLFLVASESARKRVVESGLDAERVHVVGIPVAPQFGRVPKLEARAELAIAPDAPVLLLTGGGLGLGGLEQAVEGAIAARTGAHLIVVCGRAEDLRRRVESLVRAASSPATVLGFSHRMHELMAAADVLVGKPGGLTTAEALASTLPMVLLNPIPGQEEANADLLVAMGAAALEADPRKAGAEGARLCGDGPRVEEMRASIRAARATFDGERVRHAIQTMIGRACSASETIAAVAV